MDFQWEKSCSWLCSSFFGSFYESWSPFDKVELKRDACPFDKSFLFMLKSCVILPSLARYEQSLDSLNMGSTTRHTNSSPVIEKCTDRHSTAIYFIRSRCYMMLCPIIHFKALKTAGFSQIPCFPRPTVKCQTHKIY